MLRLFGALFLILIGAAIGAQMCSGPSNPPPPSAAQVRNLPPAIAVATPAGAPAAIAQPPTHEEELAAAKLQDQQNRTYSWDGGWLRLEALEFSKQVTRVKVALYMTRGDLFYLDLAGTALVAGPLNLAAASTNFPRLRVDRLWQPVYREQLESSPGPRVPEATETTYDLEFPPMDPTTVPERVFLKLRFWKPSESERSNAIVPAASQVPSLQRGAIASLVWDLGLREAIRKSNSAGIR